VSVSKPQQSIIVAIHQLHRTCLLSTQRDTCHSVSVVMPVPIIWLVFMYLCCLTCTRAQGCLPVVILTNSTLTQVSEPIDKGNFFEAQVVNPAKYVPFSSIEKLLLIFSPVLFSLRYFLHLAELLDMTLQLQFIQVLINFMTFYLYLAILQQYFMFSKCNI
jgi:hypothetical protein